MISLEVDTWISKLIQASTVKKIRKFLIFDSPEVIPNAQLVTCFFWEGVGAEHVCFMMHNLTGPTTTGGPGGHAHPHPFFFFCSKKNREKRKKRKSFKAKTIKRLSPRSKCYCFSYSRASRIQKFFLSTDIPFQCSMAPPLWNRFRWPCLSEGRWSHIKIRLFWAIAET